MTKAIRWTPDQLFEHQRRFDRERELRQQLPPGIAAPPAKKPKASKYRNQKVDLAGEKFDSAKEARRWQLLQLQLAGGHISELRRQVPFELAPAVSLAGEPRMKPALRYIADATYQRAGQLVVEDTKSTPTRKTGEYRIKKHLMKTVLNIDITEV